MTLIPRLLFGDLDLTDAPYSLTFGRDFGAAEVSGDSLPLLLQDGEIEVSTRAGNRTMTFAVLLEGDLLSIAEAETALALEADKPRNLLTLEPGDGFGPAAVYETFRAQLTQEFSDEAEQAGMRIWRVTLRARPFARSAAPVESVGTTSGGAPPTVVTVDAGSAVTQWASTGTLSDQGSFLRSTVPFIGNQFFKAVLTYTALSPVTMTGTPLLTLAMWRTTGGVEAALPVAPTLLLDGAACVLVGAQNEGTRQRYYWQVPAGVTSFTQAKVEYLERRAAGAAGPIDFNSLQRTEAMAVVGTLRQKLLAVEVSGSARTEGSLLVEHETSPLGSTLIYTWPQHLSPSYSPPLRTRRVSGGTATTDTALVSGARDLLDTALVFDVPVSDLIAGTHQLVARLKSDLATAQTINFSAQLRIGGVDVGTAAAGSHVHTFGTTGTWRNVVLGRLMLPPADVPAGSTATVRVTVVAANAGVSNIDLDEAWLFNTTVGDLSWVECPSSKRLWLNSATTAVPRPTIYRGNNEDQTDAHYPGDDVKAFGAHRFTPPLMNVFTVTSGALDAAVSLTHYPHFIGHPTS